MRTWLATVNGRWRLERLLGEGADATLWAAVDARDGSRVALKALRLDLDAAARQRLRWEFALLAALEHPHLVRVLDLDQADASDGVLAPGQPFFTSELYAGAVDPARFAAWPPEERARALCQLLGEAASALMALHARGLVHHDVKPANLLLDDAGAVRLGDLGLAALGGGRGAVRGSPAYWAPEALAGASDPRGDLYALGVTAYELWSGRRPFAGATLAELVRAQAAPAPALVGTPAGLGRLVARLLARDPAARPSSARLVAEEARRLGARLDGALDLGARAAPVLARPALVGRAAELGALVRALAAARVVLVEGAPGSGRSRLIEEARRAQQLADAAVARPSRPWRLPTPDEPSTQLAGLAAAPAVLHLEHGDSDAAVALLTLAAGGAAAPSVVVAEVAPGALATLDGAGAGVVRVALAPLGADDVARLAASMLGSANADFARAVHRASGGEPRRAVEIVRAAAARAGLAPSAADVAALDGADLGALIGGTLARLALPARRVSEALAVIGRPAGARELAAITGLDDAAAWAALLGARAAGVVDVDAELRARLPSPAHAQAAYAAVPLRRRRRLHAAALAAAEASATSDADAAAREQRLLDRARHLLVLGPSGEAARAALVAGQVHAGRGEWDAAARWYAAAVARGDADTGEQARLLLGEARTHIADYDGALAALEPLEHARDRARRQHAALLAARALQRAGDFAAAEARLAALVAADCPAATREEARGLLGRILVGRGAYAQAVALCAAAPAPTAAVAEARGLGCLYLGHLDEAEAAFVAAGAAARARGESEARALSLRGMVAQARDDLPAAAALYGRALELARAGDDLHGAAIYAGNLGTVLREQGELERALEPTRAAARDLLRLGKRAERAGALFNYGNLLLSIGDLDGAACAAVEAESEARAVGAGRALGYAQLLGGDLERRHGRLGAALAAYHAAAATLAEAADDDRLSATLNLAEAEAEAGRPAAAATALAAGRALAEAANSVDRWTASAARVGLATPTPLAPALIDALAAAAARAVRGHRRDAAFRAALLLARAQLRAGARAAALTWLDQARSTWEEIRMRTPELSRDAADEDPDVRRLRRLLTVADGVEARPAQAPPDAGIADTEIAGTGIAGAAFAAGPSGSLAAAGAAPTETVAVDAASAVAGAAAIPGAGVVTAAALRRLLVINKRLNSELRLPRLLDLILDTVLDLTAAERGFILLTDGDGQWQVKAARNIAAAELGGEASAGGLAFSRSIAERAAREGLPIVTLDAAGDQRFEAALSVSDLKLRSVLAVPLAVKGQVVGCVYADHRLRAAAFGDAEVALVCHLAEQAAIAVENARLLAENERRRREIAELNRELERKLASQALELGELHKEVRSSRAALAVRYNYDNLVGRTPRMLELFRLLDRVTETALPVVIYGESGTGKELVARALHHNGPRRDRPFVSESCGAIPETLLEAALFGHARGAFTGADSERRGLFEIAHGGTLFLDEVGEMPAAMQVKLLRVLQQGEFRRVGGERTLHVDVRVLVASNRDLGRLVEEGKFREDLFYRLNVVRVALPPLRERRDDIPLLVEHFLRKFADAERAPPRRIARAALHKLLGYRWPGNVRELENELLRAASLGGEVIGVPDLSPQVAAGEPEAGLESPDDLGLKRRVERLERTLLAEALHRAAGNQTQAARLLGLSRFGLQKKLRRYRMEP